MSLPLNMRYTADLSGTVSQSLKALQGYDIMALELIQNADDAGASHFTIDVRDDALVIRNSATFTNCGKYGETCEWKLSGGPSGSHKSCNIHAISTMGARSKFESANQIGRFGIGFVSVFQVTDTPIIRSGNCELVLNPAAPQIEPKIIPYRDDTEFELPWATDETLVRKEIDQSPVPTGIADIVLKKVLETINSSMLFLRHIKVVEVYRSGTLTERLVIERGLNSLVLQFGISGLTKRWLLLRTSASKIIEKRKLFEDFPQLQNHNRSEEVTLAIDTDEESVNGRLFAYLPTEQSSRLPLHLNADFYPESSRKNIVLRGQGQERHWNVALIEAAADILGAAFDQLREQLGPIGLWRLGESCFEQRDDEIFGCYWKAFENAARKTNSVFSESGLWLQPNSVFYSSETQQDDTSVMLSELGLPLISEKVRPFWRSLEAAGVRTITAEMAVSAIEKRAPSRDDALRPHLPQVWQLVGEIVQLEDDNSSKICSRLQSACFLLDTSGNPVMPKEVWRLPEGVQADVLLNFVTDCPIVSHDAIAIAGISNLLDEYDLDQCAADLSNALTTEQMAKDLLGTKGESAGSLYELLLQFSLPADPSHVTDVLKLVPFLRTPRGYVNPERAQLPGGFQDPTGYLEFVDTKHFPPGMECFAEKILNVPIVSFGRYLTDYIPSIVAEHRLEQEGFSSIAEQIVQYRRELTDDGVMRQLRKLAFIPTRAGIFARPIDCYQWSPNIERVLGPDPHNWLEDSWLPQSRAGMQFRDVLEAELRMPVHPTLRHMLRRITEIADAGIINDDTVKSLNNLVDKISDFLLGADEDDKRSIAALKTVAFLPALIRGERDETQFHLPSDVYQAGRAPGFESQVPIIELNALRGPRRQHIEFMSLIDMPRVPPVASIVSHLRYCVSSGTKASPMTYELLNEAVSDKRELEQIEYLADEPYIFDRSADCYLKATEVFWTAPDAGRYWKNANPEMRRQEMLHEFLGVRNAPGPKDFARLMVEISSDSEPEKEFRQLHESCIVQICRAQEVEDVDLSDALVIIAEGLSLIDQDGNGAFPEDVLWIDRNVLAEPFGNDLNDKLITPPQTDRASLNRFYNRIGVSPLSSLAAQKLAQEPDRSPDASATSLLAERSELLLWLAPNEDARSALRADLHDLSVTLTRELKIQVELNLGAAPVVSPPVTAAAFLEKGTLHIRGSAMNQNTWAAAFRQLFLSVEHLCPQTDIKPLATTAVLLINSCTRSEAEALLIEGGFSPPIASGWYGAKASALEDLDAEVELTELAEDSALERPNELFEDEDNSPGAQSQGKIVTVNSQAHDASELGESDVSRLGEKINNRLTIAKSTTIDDISLHAQKTEPFGDQSGRPETDRSSQAIPKIDDYKSKTGGKPFGMMSEEHPTIDRKLKNDHSSANAQNGRQGKLKTNRMLAYVARTNDRPDEDRTEYSVDENKEIDASAIERAMRYEADQGRSPIEQDHFNPGFDIVSTETDGKRRLIEVKGLRGPWNARGTKMSRTQFSMAQNNADDFWLYIVEAALDPNAQQLYAIHNPFQRVDEYWFDFAWKDVAERLADTVQLNARIGATVNHAQWGDGRILEVKKTGLQTSAKVDFGFQGKKFLPFNKLKFID
ncbi:protein of unknown function [Loktanella salsilacus]|uniref:Uncharacterized protein n=1 Tax=Loktanella salsilacus TaxID=195913 RepID=A0A1I4D4A8_9RHOB|nr:DUF3883 domain-containing protein [Loktanella salsilacus]SFK88564.1 protein of unknown function [Loktanella salsilacus]